MGFFAYIEKHARMKPEKRAIGGVPWRPWDSWDTGGTFGMGGPVHPSQGYGYSLGTEGALALSSLYAGVKILSSAAASLPVKLYSVDSQGKRTVYTGPSIFDNPSVHERKYNWVFSAMVSLILHGNAWGYVTGRDGFGYPTGIEWIPPEYVIVQPSQDQPFNPLATKVYAYGRSVRWFGPDAEVFHVKGFSLPGRVSGLSLIQSAATTIVHGKQALNFGTNTLDKGLFPPGVFRNNQLEVDADQADAIRKTLVKAIRTGAPIVTGQDWDWTPHNGISPVDFELVQTMQLNAAQVAAMLDLPALRLAGMKDGNAYSSNIQEQLQILDALRPWLALLEEAFSELLPARRVMAFNTDYLLELDPKTRVEIQQIQRQTGTRTVDELRESDDMAPLPNGVGAEPLPENVLVALARGAKSIPNTWADIVQPAEPPATAANSVDEAIRKAVASEYRAQADDEAA